MNVTEFDNQFDVYFNNIMSNRAPGLNAYEKSVYLTRAQSELIKSYFNPTLNKVNQGFDGNERRQIDFSKIVKSVTIPVITGLGGNIDKRILGIGIAELPTDILMILNESLKVTRNSPSEIETIYLQVIPVKYTDYTNLMSKPFKRPLKNQAWRLQSMDTVSKVDLIANNIDTIDTNGYNIRYVKRPTPIIIEDLVDATIEGISVATECELDPIIHIEIVQRAVELAKADYIGDTQTQLAIGNASGTEKGLIKSE